MLYIVEQRRELTRFAITISHRTGLMQEQLHGLTPTKWRRRFLATQTGSRCETQKARHKIERGAKFYALVHGTRAEQDHDLTEVGKCSVLLLLLSSRQSCCLCLSGVKCE